MEYFLVFRVMPKVLTAKAASNLSQPLPQATTGLLSINIAVPFLKFHMNGIRICLLCLAFFTKYNVLEIHPCMYQFFVPFYYWVVVSCINIPGLFIHSPVGEHGYFKFESPYPNIFRCESLEPVNVTLHGKSTFADVIKDFEMDSLSWIIKVGPKCNHTYSYKRKAEGYLTQTQMWRPSRGKFEDAGAMQPQAERCQQPPEPEEARNGFSRGACRRNMATPTSWFQPSESVFVPLASRTVRE